MNPAKSLLFGRQKVSTNLYNEQLNLEYVPHFIVTQYKYLKSEPIKRTA